MHLNISHGCNDILVSTTGQHFIDMFSANGAVWLGHCNPEVVAKVNDQLQKVWLTGGLGTRVHNEAMQLLDTFLPDSHRACVFYSTGMEAAEFAIRVARVSTQHNGLVGFERGMHGKSLATAYLGWNNQDRLELPFIHRLPFVPQCPEAEILHQVEAVLSASSIAAVLIEPFQATGGGYRASYPFYQTLYELCQVHGTLLVFDEILTGFYRMGPPFFFSELGFVPDIILVGKSLANGFPASAVVVNRRYSIQAKMLPGSTFSNNPLLCAAIVATLRQIQGWHNLSGKVAKIGTIITEHLMGLKSLGIEIRGSGTLWVLELPNTLDIKAIVIQIYQQGVIVSHTRNLIRLLPPVTIEIKHLEQACLIIRHILEQAYR